LAEQQQEEEPLAVGFLEKMFMAIGHRGMELGRDTHNTTMKDPRNLLI